MKIKFTKQSLQDVEDIYKYIQQQSDKRTALEIVHKIKSGIDNLSKYPNLGSRLETDNRKLVIAGLPFVVVYEMNKNIIYILTIFHTAKKIIQI
jgi:addiction module RelE/StbE family toxin